MQNLAQKLLTREECEQINAAVQAAEKGTSGEIVCLVQSASYHYPMADLLGGAAFALPAALVLTPAIGGLFWIGHQNLWLFLGIFAILLAAFHQIVQRVPAVKRRFISRREIDEEVHEAAVTAFFQNELYRTKESNGVLLFISVFERRIWILADHGVSAIVDQSAWDALIADASSGIKRRQAAEAIGQAIEKIGKILAAHFPPKPDDTNELEDLIVSTQ